jgi:hypothetical protein
MCSVTCGHHVATSRRGNHRQYAEQLADKRRVECASRDILDTSTKLSGMYQVCTRDVEGQIDELLFLP